MAKEQDRVHELFIAALDVAADERDAWVAGQDLDDDRRALLRDLLARDARRHGQTVVVDADALKARADTALGRALEGAQVGGCVLERLLGAGGMGVVYEATQLHPRRRVAVKVLRGDKLERGRLRFEEEVQLLARMAHPNIAQVYSAGVVRLELGGVEQELPYYVMEHVPDARNVLVYAAERGLDLRARVRLCVPICAAVHHGHQRGIVHRDLKPDNLLVTGDGVPKVIDFGIARSTRLAREQVTRAGELIGTIAYLSPEQVLDAQSADVRSDLYALGVVLFELLTGESPYRAATTLPEVLHAIAHEEPRRPSRLEPRLAGDLEWILLRCLAKDPEARYPSVDALGADLEAYLGHRPVSAGRPSALYRLRKLARRSPGLVAAVGVALASLIGGGAAAAVNYADALEAREVAERRRKDSERQLARRQVSYEFLKRLLSLTGTNVSPNIRVRDLLDQAGAQLEAQHVDDPELRAELYDAIGSSYYNLGLSASAVDALERSWELFAEALGEESPRTREALRSFAFASGRVEELYGIHRLTEDAARAGAESRHEDRLWSLQQILVQHLVAGRPQEALEAADAVLAEPGAEESFPAIIARVVRDRGHALAMLGRPKEAIAEMARAEALFERIGVVGEADDARRARAINLINMGRKAEASEILERSYAYHVETYGLAGASTAHVAVNLAAACAEARPARAREVCEALLAHTQEIGADSRFARAAQRILAGVLWEHYGEQDRARALLRAVQEHERGLDPVPHWDLAMTSSKLGALHYSEQRFAEAADDYALVLDELAQIFPPEHEDRCKALASLVFCRLELDQAAELAVHLPAARAAHAAMAGSRQHLHTASSLGALLAELGQEDEARAVLADLPALAASQGVPLAPRVARAIEQLARTAEGR
jgi:tetratricopeptide (TPR) repeat protein